MKPYSNTRFFFTKGHSRDILVKRNIAGTFVIKGCTILISLALVPLIIDYLNPSQYGVWLTISSFLTWFAFFDIGFGNGLKNKLSEALAFGNFKLARVYISTTYFIIVLISSILLILFLILNNFINWIKILNAPVALAGQLSTVMLVVFSLFSFQFVLQLINIVTTAKQNLIISSLIGFLGSLLSLIIIFILNRTTEGSLIYLALASSISPVVMFMGFTLYLYNGPYKQLKPGIEFVKLFYVKDLIGLGLKFFVIQIGLIFFYHSNNIIISNVVSPTAVTTYNIAFKYFSIITMLCGIVMAPFWPAFTDANARKDIPWIRNTIRQLFKFCILMLFGGVFMLLASNFVYKFWVGPEIHIPFSLSFVLFLFTVINTYRSVFSYYFNGIGKITLQLYLIMISGLINIPLGIFLGKLMGLTGVVLATTLLCAICAVVETLQYQLLIQNRATGLWNK